jgi:hypothetical protein
MGSLIFLLKKQRATDHILSQMNPEYALVAEHCWVNRERERVRGRARERERESAGVTCGRFGTVRLKFKLSTYIEKPLVI